MIKHDIEVRWEDRFCRDLKRTEFYGFVLFKNENGKTKEIKNFKRIGQMITYLKKNDIDLAHNKIDEYYIIAKASLEKTTFLKITIQAIVQLNNDEKIKESSRYKLG